MKLEAALDAFRLNVNRAKAVDVGASTGGFTDCLLKRGAAVVYAIDAGVGQLHPSLVEDGRVRNIEKFNARELSSEITEGLCDIAVADVSFISQTYLLAGIASVLKSGGVFVSLIKPQFEAGRQALGKNGVVGSGAYRFLAAKRVISCACENGFDCLGFIRSPIEGGDGNK
jgi:23S rRNA (cytidine1920-2'-O)/16S rRNA (cytidine1409-2'-O)-methyltransferase